MDITSAVKSLRKGKELRSEIFSNPTPWQKTLLARHPDRPYTLDYIDMLSEDFIELHGDRRFSDDPAIAGGFCNYKRRACNDYRPPEGKRTKRIYRNFGQPQPEGWKALRLMKLAERFKKPIITLIDTPEPIPA